MLASARGSMQASTPTGKGCPAGPDEGCVSHSDPFADSNGKAAPHQSPSVTASPKRGGSLPRLQRQLLDAVILLEEGTGGRQRTHTVARGIVELQPLGQRQAGDTGVLFQRYQLTPAVSRVAFSGMSALPTSSRRLFVVKMASSVSSGIKRIKASSALSLYALSSLRRFCFVS